MTELDYLSQIAFWSHVEAFATCWIAGALGLKVLIYIKNHRDLW